MYAHSRTAVLLALRFGDGVWGEDGVAPCPHVQILHQYSVRNWYPECPSLPSKGHPSSIGLYWCALYDCLEAAEVDRFMFWFRSCAHLRVNSEMVRPILWNLFPFS